MATYEGNLVQPSGRFAVVAARFNGAVVQALLSGALDGLRRHGIADNAVDVVWVPGAFEIPLAARRLAGTRAYAALIALGAVIRGETGHYDHVATEAAHGIARVSCELGVPISFGILTCDTLEQALDRAGGKAGNKGLEAAFTAIQMANLLGQLPPG